MMTSMPSTIIYNERHEIYEMKTTIRKNTEYLVIYVHTQAHTYKKTCKNQEN